MSSPACATIFVVSARIGRRRAAPALEGFCQLDCPTASRRIRRGWDPELLVTIAHDLRNPLTVLRASVQLLRRHAESAPAAPDTWLDRGLRQIEEAGLQIGYLIDEMVDLTHLRAGDPLPLKRGPTDLRELAAQALADAQSRGERSRVQLEVAAPSVVGHWDASRLRRVLENLLSNAIKYSPPDHEIIVRVAHEAESTGDWVVLEVRDHGDGIPTADQAHIFEPFWRGSNVDSVPGTGLGLASVKQIVEAHGGSIGVVSGEGEGTTVTVRLPSGGRDGGGEPS